MRGKANSVRFWRPDAWPGLELMAAHLVDQRFVRHFHDAYTIGLNDGGGGAFDCRARTQHAEPGTLNLIEPGEVHTGQPTAPQGWFYRNFYIDAPVMRTLFDLAGLNGLPVFTSSVGIDARAVQAFGTAFGSLTTSDTTRLEQQTHLILAIRHLRPHASAWKSADNDGVRRNRQIGRRLRDYLDAHAARPVSLRELAALAGCSAYRVIRLVQAETGLPPHAYQNAVRVNQARRLLQEGMPIADVAISCGFYDQSHLYRVFHRVHGLPPGQYQRHAISSKTVR